MIVRVLRSLLWRGRRSASVPGCSVAENVNIRYAEVFAEGRNKIGDGSKVSGRLELGYATTLGRLVNINGSVCIGKYCSIGPCVAIYTRDHPLTHLSTYNGTALFNGRLKVNDAQIPVKVGNDVWIGHGAIILKGVVIGDGAVIAAGAVVTHAVSPYSIVAGSPAREIGTRFSPQIVDRLLQLRWWDLGESELSEIEVVFHVDLANDPHALETIDEAVRRVEVAKQNVGILV